MMAPRHLNFFVNGILLFLLLRVRSDGVSLEFLASSRVVGKFIVPVLDLVEELPACICRPKQVNCL